VWSDLQRRIVLEAEEAYRHALKLGIAREVARAVLPEGLTVSRLYMAGTLRSWVHYLQTRLDPSTQLEHRQIAESIVPLLRSVAPVTIGAFFPKDQHGN